MDPRNLIACSQCSHAKNKCDKTVPCAQCVAKGLVCQPRYSRRLPSAATQRKRASRQQIQARSPATRHHDGEDRSTYAQQQTQSNAESTLSTDLAEVQGGVPALEDMTGMLEFDWNLPASDDTLGSAISMMIDGFPSVDPSQDWYNSWPASSGDCSMEYASESIGRTTPESLKGNLSSKDPLPKARLTFPPLDQRTTASPPYPSTESDRGGPHGRDCEDDSGTDVGNGKGRNLCASFVEDLVALMESPDPWKELSQDDTRCDSPHDAAFRIDGFDTLTRERFLGAVQMFVSRAIQVNRDRASSSNTNGMANLRPLVTLPSSAILEEFIAAYAHRVNSYLGLAPAASIRTNKVLQYSSAQTGSLLLMLFIAHGAMLDSSPQARTLAFGFMEVCRIGLLDLLDQCTLADAMTGRCALLYLTLCAWSGNRYYADLAVVQRGLFLSMLRTESTMSNGGLIPIGGAACAADSEKTWSDWREHEWKIRQMYAWLQVDHELSLFHDLQLSFATNDIDLPLPCPDDVWQSPSAEAWAEAYTNWRLPHQDKSTSLRDLFQHFVRGDLQDANHLSPRHMRLLLYPLQAMASYHQRLLPCFGASRRTNGNNIMVSRLSVLRGVEEVRNLLEQWFELNKRCVSQTAVYAEPGMSLLPSANMVMFHLMSLNLLVNIPEIERVMQQRPPVTAAECAQMCREIQHVDDRPALVCHAGQIFRLISTVEEPARPSWWPLAVYRAAIACWFVNMLSPASDTLDGCVSTDSTKVVLNELPYKAGILQRFLNAQGGQAVFAKQDGSEINALSSTGALRLCLDMLQSKSPTPLCSTIKIRVSVLSRRWLD